MATTPEVLISWSKPKSKAIATKLYGWLPNVFPGVKPWISTKDIDKGTDWFAELQTVLSDAKLCVICLTEENIRSPWLYYEAGAIATKGDGVRVCPYLVGIGPSILADGPLSKFQCTEATADDTLLLLNSFNRVLGDKHAETLLDGNFRHNWPILEAELERIAALTGQKSEFVRTDVDDAANFNLSSEARSLLLEAAQDQHATIICSRTSSGLEVATNGKSFAERHNARSEAIWKQAVADLVAAGLAEDRGYKGEVFGLTGEGFQVADRLRVAEDHVAYPGTDFDDNDIITILEAHLEPIKRQLTATALNHGDIDHELGLPSGSTKRLIGESVKKFGLLIRRQGMKTTTFDSEPLPF